MKRVAVIMGSDSDLPVDVRLCGKSSMNSE